MKSNNDKKPNPQIAVFFPNEKFGEGSFLSAPIDTRSAAALNESKITDERVEQRWALKKKKTENGLDYFSLEVLNPRAQTKPYVPYTPKPKPVSGV